MASGKMVALVGIVAAGWLLEAEADEPAPPPFYADKTNLLVWRDSTGEERPVDSVADWQRRRDHILASMQLVMGPLPGEAVRAAPEVELGPPIEHDDYTRYHVWLTPEPQDRLPGWLLVPHGASDRRRAAVLCLHQTTRIGKDEPAGLGGLPNLHYAAELASRGYVTLAVDYPNFGEYEFNPYEQGYASATMKGIWNHIRAVDYLASRDDVDAERLGVIGHSLGGHNSLFLAAFDTRLRCIVSCCGFCSFRRYYEGDLTGWSHRGYMPRIAERYGLDPGRMPFDFTEVVAALAPRAFLAVAPVDDANFAVEGVRECIAAAAPVYERFEAADRLAADYPAGGHDFPPAARRRAYEWLDRWLAAGG